MRVSSHDFFLSGCLFSSGFSPFKSECTNVLLVSSHRIEDIVICLH